MTAVTVYSAPDDGRKGRPKHVELKVNKHFYFCHPLVLSSPTLMMHGHMNLKFIKYCSSLHVSSIKCSSSGGHSCIQAAYGTVTLYKSPGGLSIRS